MGGTGKGQLYPEALDISYRFRQTNGVAGQDDEGISGFDSERGVRHSVDKMSISLQIHHIFTVSLYVLSVLGIVCQSFSMYSASSAEVQHCRINTCV